ncbi:MAG: ATP-binding protein [Planctomycetota bacterium]
MRQYLVFRVLVTVLGFLLVTLYLSCISPETRDATRVYLYSLLVFYLCVGVVSKLTFPRWKGTWAAYKQQVLIDFVVQALLVWTTGGVVSIFSPILFVTLASATGVSSQRGSDRLATCTTIFLAGTTVAYSSGIVPSSSSWSRWIFSGENSIFIASYLLANILGLYVISKLGSRLSTGLRDSEYLREEIIENMAEGLVAVDRSGKIVHLNEEARKLLGLRGGSASFSLEPLDQVLLSATYRARSADGGADPMEALVDHDRRKILDAFSSDRRRFEVQLRSVDGCVRPVEVKISTLLDDKQRLRCRVGLFSDLSLKREVEVAERRIQKLEELQVMALGIAHELRNPLASIRGCVQEMGRAATEDSIQKRYSSIVIKESDRLDRIIEEFLSYARSAPVDLIPLDLFELVHEAVDLIQSRQDVEGRKVEFLRPEFDCRVYGDRDRLLQVFLNLGINAIQATEDDSGRIEIEVGRGALPGGEEVHGGDDSARSAVEICVRDNGRGIPEEDMQKVFTPFYTTKHSGNGLGLSIVDRIVRDHMGFIDLERNDNGGTTVRLTLPAFGDSSQVHSVPGRQEELEYA